jgi:hypothetical protein
VLTMAASLCEMNDSKGLWQRGVVRPKGSAEEHRHFNHGYAVTSPSSQGFTAERVLVHADSGVDPDLLTFRTPPSVSCSFPGQPPCHALHRRDATLRDPVRNRPL